MRCYGSVICPRDIFPGHCYLLGYSYPMARLFNKEMVRNHYKRSIASERLNYLLTQLHWKRVMHGIGRGNPLLGFATLTRGQKVRAALVAIFKLICAARGRGAAGNDEGCASWPATVCYFFFRRERVETAPRAFWVGQLCLHYNPLLPIIDNGQSGSGTAGKRLVW